MQISSQHFSNLGRAGEEGHSRLSLQEYLKQINNGDDDYDGDDGSDDNEDDDDDDNDDDSKDDDDNVKWVILG
jgi:hypothetical protein